MQELELYTIGKTAKLLGVSINTLRRWDESGKFKAFRVGHKGHRYYLRSDIALLLKDWPVVAECWAKTPNPIEPQAGNYCATRDAFQARLEKFQTELLQNPHFRDSFSLLIAVTGEIGNNAFDHNLGNWPDVAGIFFAYDLNKRVVVIADRGQGIWKTLSRVKPELADHQEALQTGFTEILSGRAPEIRGNGLKFVRQVVTSSPMELFFQTGDASLNLSEKNHKLRIDITEDYLKGCFATIKF